MNRNSRIHQYIKRFGPLLIVGVLIMGLASCDGSCSSAPIQHDLTMSGTEGGKVIISGEGTYADGTVVMLEAVADECYEFVNWTGADVADPYSPITTVTMDEAKSLTANFALLSYDLTADSTDGGEVTSPGEDTFTCGTVVDLVAVAEEDYYFVNWSGDVDTIANINASTTTITIMGDYSITANFELIPPGQFVLTISSTAGGSVTTPGNGIFAYDEGATVNLTAEADEGYQFLNWTGNVSNISDVNAATTTITMDGDYSITANFEQIPLEQFTLTISSTAGGSVTTPGNGIFAYDEGATVNLTAEADEGYQFLNWTGNVSNISDVNAATTTITMDGDYSITANFALPIWDWYDLDAIRDNLGGSYILMNDLDSTTAGYTELASKTANGRRGWQPIGTTAENDKFAGSFDGQGHEICDLFIYRPAQSNVGLFGVVGGGGVIENVSLMNVTVTGYSGVGGLVGQNEGPVSNSYSTGRVTGGWSVGGLAGQNSGNVSNSYSTGRVTGGWSVGGLAGQNSGNVSNSYSTGRVTGCWSVGGLVGQNEGPVSNSYSTGRVTGNSYVGGLVGQNEGPVSNSYSTGRVTGGWSVGGLAGQNEDIISDSHSTGRVTGNSYVGGLVGQNEGAVNNSYSSGRVTGNSYVGGLAGQNEDIISDSHSTGRVTGNSYVGGLVGRNEGPVNNSYSTGRVTGNSYVGGLVGQNEGPVSNSYSTGRVTGSWSVGGLMGYNIGTVSNSFWDTQTSGRANSDGGDGKTTTEMMDFGTFDGVGWDIIAVDDANDRNTDHIWNIVDEQTYPFLSWQ